MENKLKYKEAAEIFEIYKGLTDAERYFSSEEINESKRQFIVDIMDGNKAHYISFLTNQVEEIKPAGIHGGYDFELIKEYENIIQMIESF